MANRDEEGDITQNTDNSEVQQLINKRSRLRSIVARFICNAEDALSSFDEPSLSCILQTLKDKNLVLNQMNDSVQEIIDEEQLTSEITTSLHFSAEITQMIEKINTFLTRNVTITRKAVTHQGSIKLPKLHLPIFSGNKIEYQGFWDMYTHTILQNDNLSKVQKFAYLMSSLAGEAKLVLSGLTLSDANFDLALQLLHQRFGQPDSVGREHLKQLQNCKPPGKTVASLKQFSHELTMHMRCLENLKIYPEQYEVLLMPTLLQKLPEDIRLHMLSTAHDKKMIYKFEGFLSLLNSEIEIREECRENSNNSSRLPELPSTSFDLQGSATALHTVEGQAEYTRNQRNSPVSKFCVYCESREHFSSDCTHINDITTRVEFLKQHNRCFSCLRKNHEARTCRAKKKCSKCGKSHHISICKQLDPMSSPKSSESAVLLQQDGDNPGLSLFIHQKTAVILPSAIVILSAPNGLEARVRLLLDQCSTRSFIKKDICKELNIPASSECLKVNTFGSEDIQTHVSGRATFTIRKVSGGEEIPIEANLVDTVCSPEPSYRLSGFSQFSGLEMADEHDPRDEDMPISILVGADYYYDIVTDTTRRGPNKGPVALSSKIG